MSLSTCQPINSLCWPRSQPHSDYVTFLSVHVHPNSYLSTVAVRPLIRGSRRNQPVTITTATVIGCVNHPVHLWRKLDVDAFAADLQASDAARWRCVQQLQRHAATVGWQTRPVPCVSQRPRRRTMLVGTMRSACLAIKRATRRLEKVYRRSRLDVDREALRRHFVNQRQLHQAKFTSYWSAIINDYYCGNPSKLWRTNVHLADARFNADDFADFFNVRAVILATLNDSSLFTTHGFFQIHAWSRQSELISANINSNFSFLSEVAEQTVASRYLSHLIANSHLP